MLNEKNFNIIEVVVSVPKIVNFVERLKEVVKGEESFTDIVILSSKNQIFSNCSNLNPILHPTTSTLQANLFQITYPQHLKTLEHQKKTNNFMNTIFTSQKLDSG